MGKKAPKAVRAGSAEALAHAAAAEDDVEMEPLDEEAAAEEAALRELELEREAEEAELELSGAGAGEGSSTGASYNKRALEQFAEEMCPELPWVERLDVVASVPLEVPDAHDDLARELAFYEQSLAAVKTGRERLKAQNISWKRPVDFFCEMIKSDSHMARVKDKLIFEQKKMDAFEQRKERQNQRKFAKAVQDQKQREKIATKKENVAAVEQWRKEHKGRRRDGLLEDEDGLDELLQDKRAAGRVQGASRKRLAANKKYGWGGPKNKHATRNDRKSLNDDRDFVAKPGKRKFGGGGGGGGGGGKGGSRPGKAARAAKRQKNRSS